MVSLNNLRREAYRRRRRALVVTDPCSGGTSQRSLPENTSTALIVPHGGALHGRPLGEKTKVRYMP